MPDLHGKAELYLNVIDTQSGVSYFSFDFRNPSEEQGNRMSHLEAGFINAITSNFRRLGNETITLLRHKRTFTDGAMVYVDNVLGYAENSIAVMHLSTGDTPTEKLPETLLDSLSVMLTDEQSTSDFIQHAPSTEHVSEIMIADSASKLPLHIFQRNPSEHGPELWAGVLLTMGDYTTALVSGSESVERDEVLLLRSIRETDHKHIDRYFVRNGGRIGVIGLEYDTQTDTEIEAVMLDVCDELVRSFEKKYAGSIGESFSGEFGQFSGFQENVWQTILQRHSEILGYYQSRLVDDLGEAGINSLAIRRLDGVRKRDSGSLYGEIDLLYDNALYKHTIAETVEKLNTKFAAMRGIFQIGLYHHPDSS